MASILVTHTARFLRGPDDQVYTTDPVLDYAFFTRYLSVFDTVGVAARVRRVEKGCEDLPRASGPNVSFRDLPDYRGPWEFLRTRKTLTGPLREAIHAHDAHCLRVPCAHTTLAWRELLNRGAPFGLEIAGDPAESLSRGAYPSILRPLARWVATRDLRIQCITAGATAYVTREALQRRYPPAHNTFTTHYSSIDLPPEAMIDAPRTDFRDAGRLIFVGTLAVLYKAPDVLIRAVARIDRPNVRLNIVGDGAERAGLESLAASLGLGSRITFHGKVPAGTAVRERLDAADLFVLPSRGEGLPRAMIEAMARGLPCIGSDTAGIPELLPPEDRVPPGDVDALARKIVALLDDPKRMRQASRRNLEVSQDYARRTLAPRREAFYAELRRICCPER